MSSWKRWQRSILRRTLVRWLNLDGLLLLQAMPLAMDSPRFDVRSLWRKWIAGAPKGNDLDPIRMMFLATNIVALETANVPGAFAELGVWRGNSAKVIHMLAPHRVFYLFDTFSGFDERDAIIESRSDIKQHFVDTTAAQVEAFLGAPEVVRIVQGRFPDTAHVVSQDERFAFVHIDCDLYEPTKDALTFFYPRMSPGGLVVLHDHDSGRWPGVARAVGEFLADKSEGVVHIPDTSGSVAFIRARK